MPILISRQHYRCCHIQVPDMDQPLPAIFVNHQYYSFLKAVKEKLKAQQTAANLEQRGEQVAITQTPKGYTLWVLEPDAQRAVSRRQNQPLPQSPKPQPSESTLGPVTILDSPRQYQLCWIRVPDLAEPLVAIIVAGQYYSRFQSLQDREQLQRVVSVLESRGDQSVTTRTTEGYIVWVREPDAVRVVR